MKEPNNLRICLDSAQGGPAGPVGDGSGQTVKGLRLLPQSKWSVFPLLGNWEIMEVR